MRCEPDLQREAADVVFCLYSDSGGTIAADVVDANESCIGVDAPRFAVFQHVQRAIGAEGQVHRADKLPAGHERFNLRRIVLLVEVHDFDPVASPFEDEQAAIPCLGESGAGIELRVEVVHGAGAGGSSTAAKLRKLGGIAIRIIQHCGDGRRQDLFAGVVGRFVAWFCEAVQGTGDSGGVVEVGVGLIVGDEIRPAEIAGFSRLVDFVVASWSARPVTARVGPHFTPIHKPCSGIHGHPPRIATAHAVDLGATTGTIGRKQVAFGDFKGAFGRRADAENFAAVAVGIGG